MTAQQRSPLRTEGPVSASFARPQQLDIGGASKVALPPSFQLPQGSIGAWPDGFWPLFNSATSHYRKGHYSKAKKGFLSARALKADYNALDTALLRTFRKLYKAAIEKRQWEIALKELTELFDTLPSGVTEADSKSLSKVLAETSKTRPDLAPLRPQPKPSPPNAREKPEPQIEASVPGTVRVEVDAQQPVKKSEAHLRTLEKRATTRGFLFVYKESQPRSSTGRASYLRAFSPDAAFEADQELATNLRRAAISPDGSFILCYTEDLQLSLWSSNGHLQAQRSIRREADGDINHVRSLAISEAASVCMFTASTRAYLLDAAFRPQSAWLTPPPPGYEVVCPTEDLLDERVQAALSTLDLNGRPTSEAIKTQFRRLAMRYHPDRNPGDAQSLEHMKRIIAAYEVLSDENVAAALEGLGLERYYKLVHEIPIDIPQLGVSFSIGISMSGSGDWIYASHITPQGDRIYLGCYSGSVYSLTPDGTAQTIYSTDAPIRGIFEQGSYLYIWTHTSMFVVHDYDVANHLDLRGAQLELILHWGLVIRKDHSLLLYLADGSWFGTVQLPYEPHQVIPTSTGLVVFTSKARYRIHISVD